ncbi:hypothetical protein QYE76_010970 [Lolium multiflorum]|uniref:Uncharacterized protein n=1 Tax=Lolium multiflorum TaxID=4521 RepID=A0AAD8TY98_LOLMU|nr:hypothetical protein QYE76_010970 [Lolium multiflorum]
MGRADKELKVYRRRSVQEREEAAAREREEEAAAGLNQLGVFSYTTEVLPVPKSRPKPIPKMKKYKHQLREGGPTEVLPYYVEPNLEEKVKAGVILCNCYQGYPTRHEAVAKWRKHQSNKSKMKMKTFLVLSLLLTIVAAVLYFILV